MNTTNQSMLDKIVSDYINALPEKIASLELLLIRLQRNDELYEEVFRMIHSLKGTSGTYGCEDISKICHEFEDELLSQNREQQYNLDILLGYIDSLNASIEAKS